jgi:nicotinamide riboside kinase
MNTRFVAIIGGSGSGKTWLADRLAAPRRTGSHSTIFIAIART